MTARIGPRMIDALYIVAAEPGCTKQHVSIQVGPNSSNRYGYATVQRCIKHGLIAAELTPRGYRLTLTPAGQRVWEEDMASREILDWYYGPTANDPDPGKMWCRDCGGEVSCFDGGYVCGCGRES